MPELRKVCRTRSGFLWGFAVVIWAGLAQAADTAELCNRLATEKEPEAFTSLARELQTATHRASMVEAFGSCGLDYALLKYEHCQRAFRRQELVYLLKYCPEEAWSTARAQCERNADTVSPRYLDYCNKFYTGMAPTYGK